MSEQIEAVVKAMDPKSRKEIEAIGHALSELGVTDIREAGADAFGKSPTTTPLPVEHRPTIER